ncbi:MAG TPA: VIT and VWA domain-containing protein [Kofleriaceae bacterium]|nr:VIT and VWA domain-containing protein [Kofleriaceae bacterium]
MSPRTNLKSITLLAAATLLACGDSRDSRTADHGGSARTHAPSAPMRLPVELLKARGVVRVRTGNDQDWKPLTAGMTMASVREIEVTRNGAVVSLGHGDAAGRLWLRAGSHVRLGQDDGGVFIEALAGKVRLRRSAAAIPVTVASRDGMLDITGDVLLGARKDGTTAVLATGARPELADWSLVLEHDDEGSGVGSLEARATSESKSEPLALRKLDVRVKTAGDLAMTEVEHVFFNPSAEAREGTFRFPVPDGAVLTGMAMEISGRMMEGEIVEREKARAVYEKIVDEMQDPALLEWEQGNWFKLRVFPIEAAAEKRVVIRYTTPLARDADGWTYDYMVGFPEDGAASTTIGTLTVTVDGKIAAKETDVKSGLDVSVPVATTIAPVMREVKTDGTYTAVRVAADPSLFGGAATVAHGPRTIAFVFDTSRSSLEGRPLQIELLKTTLGELRPEDRFVVLASDVGVTAHAAEMVAPSATAVTDAVAFVDQIEPDGASDIGAALAAAAALEPTDVIYIGDGVPTWGELGKAPLATAAAAIHAPIHAALVGKGASSELWAELAGASGGRAMMVRRPIEAARFALAAAHGGDAARVRNARVAVVTGEAGGTIYPSSATTLWDGDEMVAIVHTPAGAPVPGALMLTGDVAGKPVSQKVELAGAVETVGVARRWAVHHIAALEAAGLEKDVIVKASRDFGVLSRYTSLLVLESEEAYKLHDIERKQKEEAEKLALAQAPQVTGGDLDTLGAREASLSPDEIQPGDPEIKIPAPRDAQRVIVTFPWGETKVAEWDRDVDAWMVRFLIDKDTPDGDYQARVSITHADGHVEVLHLGYTVDTVAPVMKLTATWTGDGYRITARQQASADGSRRKDADRVEVVLPGGEILMLAQSSWGKFEGEWKTGQLTTGTALRVVVRDHALNQAAMELVVGQ